MTDTDSTRWLLSCLGRQAQTSRRRDSIRELIPLFSYRVVSGDGINKVLVLLGRGVVDKITFLASLGANGRRSIICPRRPDSQ